MVREPRTHWRYTDSYDRTQVANGAAAVVIWFMFGEGAMRGRMRGAAAQRCVRDWKKKIYFLRESAVMILIFFLFCIVFLSSSSPYSALRRIRTPMYELESTAARRQISTTESYIYANKKDWCCWKNKETRCGRAKAYIASWRRSETRFEKKKKQLSFRALP